VSHRSFAGSDTTAIALRSIFYYLLKNPAFYERLRKELDEAEANGLFSDSVTYAQARQLVFFQAVVREALRLCPSVALCMPRYPPKGGATICGEFFPDTVQVGCNAHIIHMDKAVYGDDALEFNPYRWLQSEERNREMEKYLITFGAGSRTCVGKNISLMVSAGGKS
jgi:cytochrome P450